jgi:hypothetical protein
MRPGRALSWLLLAAMLTSACGGGTEDDPGLTVTPLTPVQASLLAEVLHRNTEEGGAAFALAARDATSGGTITLEGHVDWTRGHGRASVAGYRDADGAVVEVAWTRDAVAERRPDQATVLAARGEDPDATFLLRPVDASGNALDRLLAVVLGLAIPQPDNAQLVLQNPGAGFVRIDELRGVPVEVLRYSQRSTFWVDTASGTLLRFEGVDSSGGSPIVVDLLELGPVGIALPPVSALPLRP